MNENDRRRDDLTVIKGIGPARQKWFGSAMGVVTYRQLAALSVEKVEAQLREDGKIPSRSEIEAWLAQAKELAAQQPDEPEPVRPKSAARKTTEKVTVAQGKSQPAAALATAVNPGAGTWKPFASFVVEYQSRRRADQTMEHRTAVHYMEADISATWAGIENKKLGTWMEQQAHVPVVASKAPAVAKSTVATAADLKAIQVRLRQSPDYSSIVAVGGDDRPFLGHVRHENPISLEVDFELSPAGAADIKPPRQVDYSVHCHLHNLSAGAGRKLIDMKRDPSAGDQPGHKALLQDLLLEPGVYELGILVKRRNPLQTDYFKLPKLNVL